MAFFDWNGSQARSDINSAYKKANAALDQGYQTSQGYYDQAASNYQPWVTSGQQGQQMYADLLGLNGTDARSNAQGVITSDPLWTGQLASDQNAALKALNARGLGASGTAALAGQRVLYQNYNNILSDYANLGNQGLSAAGSQSNVYTGQGDNAYGYGATKANNAIGQGSAISQTRNTGLNNVLGILGTGAKAATAFGAL
ncbi:hypothetical protein [Hyphomicrobium sp. MC1]|uniref:hypothetical protein n=1 Tax=Hyphomicrobium sp. (strain MC1) TaxID=717785 RepID=UPI000213DAB8|nr:hypothetical protein [Hyphomicrobium sp. MC1]CCB64477.1 conserved protein of unknown function [Hyphomicrobium sp. MC1]